MRWTASSPAAMSTPASAYVRGCFFLRSGTSGFSVSGVEHSLGQRDVRGDGIVAGEAGRTKTGAWRVDGLDQLVELEVGQRVGSEVVADLVDGHVGGDQLGL